MTSREPRPRPRTTLRVTRPAMLALGLALVASACTTPVSLEPTKPTNAASTEAVTGPAAAYYGQQLAWTACGSFQCADLRVPLDHENPGTGQDLSIAVLKVPARSPSKRLGSVVVNPGGPGASGIEYAKAADFIVGTDVRKFYDVVGFDPRGIGQSDAIDCLTDPEMDAFLSADPSPDDAPEQQALLKQAEALGAGCESRNPDLTAHMATVDVARDVDILRSALGDEQLTYLGKSYGTLIGSTYAGLFPKRVGRMVLDGVLPPDLTSAEMSQGQADGFERATRAYVQNCVDGGSCPLGTTLEAGMQALRTMLAGFDASPIPSGDPSVPQLGEGWASYGMAQALYDQGSWATLTSALEQAKQRDGSGLMALADGYARRMPGGQYESNMLEAMYAVNCLDRPDSADLADFVGYAKQFSVTAPTWGTFMAWGSLPCGHWPVDRGIRPEKITAAGSNPIVVVGTTRDPATPYEWSQRLADQLENASLLTMDGDGHTAYMRQNPCIDRAIDAYYVSGIVPKDGTTC